MTVYRYETNWHNVRAMRIALVNRVHSGDAEAMDALRTLALHAGVFAVLSVHNQVGCQESQYARWLRGEAITGLSIHVNAVENVAAWIAAHMTLSLFDDLSGHTFADAAMQVVGLGTAKATFFAALMGFDDCGCIDSHMFAMLRERGVTTTTEVPKSMKSYRRLYAQSGWRHTLDQWRDFLTVKRFAATQHDVFFVSVLGAAAVLA